MSNTKKHKLKGKYNRASNMYFEKYRKLIKKLKKQRGLNYIAASEVADHLLKKPWKELSAIEKEIIWNPSRNPGWWNHLTSTIKNRRKERDTLKKIDIKSKDEFDDSELPLGKKPMIYFW